MCPPGLGLQRACALLQPRLACRSLSVNTKSPGAGAAQGQLRAAQWQLVAEWVRSVQEALGLISSTAENPERPGVQMVGRKEEGVGQREGGPKRVAASPQLVVILGHSSRTV